MTRLFQRLFLAVITIIGLSGCEPYLDVEPKSSLSEEALFSSATGFQQALTGIYALMAGRELYGDNLSLGFVSALAQNYNTSGANAPFVDAHAYNYKSDEVITTTTEIWNSSYNLIAAANQVIENVDLQDGLLTSQQYNHFKGEALALRAYLHFDLLRLFGDSYVHGAGNTAIPYKTVVDESPTAPSTTSEVLSLIITDLKAAEELLEEGMSTDHTLLSSRFSINYFVVKALQARVYLYAGDKENAYAAAKEVIESGNYDFVEPSSVSAQPQYRDRLFTSELIFALRVKDIADWVQNYFHFYSGSSSNSLTRPEEDINAIYELSSGGSTDIRRLYLFEYEGSNLYPSKFWQTSSYETLETRLDQIVPLIRLSEMYYILAETAPTIDEGAGYLNTVLQNRNVNRVIDGATITPQEFRDEITKEYQKELYAEGQLFYYYKRLDFSTIDFYDGVLSGDTYVLPIPDREKEFNPYYE